jgi:hypothetical protein
VKSQEVTPFSTKHLITQTGDGMMPGKTGWRHGFDRQRVDVQGKAARPSTLFNRRRFGK